MVGKVVKGIVMALLAAYFVILGIMFAYVSIKEGMPNFIMAAMPFAMILDFFLRRGLQQTPLMMVRPYLLLPIKRRDVADCFTVALLLDMFTAVWLFLFVTYAIVYASHEGGAGQTLLTIAVCEFLMMVNALWYQLVRTLSMRNALWWLLSAVYLLPLAMLLTGGSHSFDVWCDLASTYALNPMAIAIYVAVFVALFMVNRKVLLSFIANEATITTPKETTSPLVSLAFLSKLGTIGEFMKMEIKSALRNKNVRNTYVNLLLAQVLLIVVFSFSDMSERPFEHNFWCFYTISFFCIISLQNIMGVEGHYIDLLMLHRNDMSQLLHAKYYYNCALLAIPTIMLMPSIGNGAFTLPMVATYVTLTAGPCLMIQFQLAAYNKDCTPLNAKVTGKGNYQSLRLLFFGLEFIPIMATIGLVYALGEAVAYTAVTIVSVVCIAAHPLWLRSICRRMAANKYENIEGFRSSR